jgi:hypothetical protein
MTLLRDLHPTRPHAGEQAEIMIEPLPALPIHG